MCYGEIMASIFPSSQELLEQEYELRFNQVNFDGVDFGRFILHHLIGTSETLAFMIRQNSGTIFHVSFPGTHPIHDQWLIRKCRVVELFGHSSMYVMQEHGEESRPYTTHAINQMEYAFFGGAFPLADMSGRAFGVIAFSGTDQNSEHNLAVEMIKSYLKK